MVSGNVIKNHVDVKAGLPTKKLVNRMDHDTHDYGIAMIELLSEIAGNEFPIQGYRGF